MNNKKRKAVKKKKKTEFSKKLLFQESILIWIVTIGFFVMSFICIHNQYFGELPWLTAMATCPWAAYAVSQGFYYKKAEKENTKGGIKYDTVMKQYEMMADSAPPVPESELSDEGVG